MTLAWFRPDRRWSPHLDDLTGVITRLRASRAVEHIDASRAHDFVWRHARGAFDLCVYELDNTEASQFIWPYLLNYPGVVVLRTSSLHDGRATALLHRRRYEDYAAELAFSEAPRPVTTPWHLGHGSWPMVRVPLLASRLTVVADSAWAAQLQLDHPGARVRYAPVGVDAPVVAPGVEHERPPLPGRASPRVRFAVLDGGSPDAAVRAARRAGEAGAPVELLTVSDPDQGLRQADVVLALRRPSLGEPVTAALLGMATSKAVVVAETSTTAGWPALDPQTWQPRGFDPTAAPIAVSIGPRDEEHSLTLAMRRLATDEGLRRTLGSAARAWWAGHATPAHATTVWETLLAEAATLDRPARPDGWPTHLAADGTGRAREILAEFGLSVDSLV